MPSVAVPRLFHPNAASSVEQHSHGNIERLLRPAHNHDLICLAANATRRSKIRGNRLAQFFQSHRMTVIERFCSHTPGVPGHQAVPIAKREMVRGHLSDTEGTPASAPWRIRDRLGKRRMFCNSAPSARASRDAARPAFSGQDTLIGERQRYGSACAGPALKVSLCRQLCIGA